MFFRDISGHMAFSPHFAAIIFQVKMALGGNVKIVISGAAPLAGHVEEFLRVVTCAPVVQGYGMFFTLCHLVCGIC